MNPFAFVGRQIIDRCQIAGRATTLFVRSLIDIRLVVRTRAQLLRQLDTAGFGSIVVLCLISGLTGMILVVQTGSIFEEYGILDRLGGFMGATFTREMGPLWAAVIILARVGSAMAAELGTMTINEEVDALRAMSISPVRYLAMPRVLALVVAMPLLTAIADFVGMAGSAYISKLMFGLAYDVFWASVRNVVTFTDFFGGLIKSAIFGAIIATIACDQGLNTKDGAEGVGRTTTTTVVLCVIFVLFSNLLMTSFIELVYKRLVP